MILGFLGKGGSGKSSVSSQMAFFMSHKNKSVLAIDADHNMDLSYNLSGGAVPELEYFSQSLCDLLKARGLDDGETYTKAFVNDVESRFSLTPLSGEIAKYSCLVQNNIRLMTAGPQTDSVLYGMACSHSLTTPLKILLPLLTLEENEVVIVDEKAGADGVSTGIVTGIDVGAIVCEASLHSVKTAKQIAELMDFYETPYLFVGNKIASAKDEDFIISELGQDKLCFLKDSTNVKQNPTLLAPDFFEDLQNIFDKAKTYNQNNRLERTIKKFNRNQEFIHR